MIYLSCKVVWLAGLVGWFGWVHRQRAAHNREQRATQQRAESSTFKE
jgi:hypothetical protein